MKSFVVIGCGRFGRAVAKTLTSLGKEVMAIDKDFDTVQEISSQTTTAVQCDVMDEIAMKELGIGNFDCAIISIASDVEASVMATVMVKEMGVKFVVAKSLSDMHAKVLTKIGADRIVFPERDMGIRLAHNLNSESILDYIQLSSDYGILEVSAMTDWAGKTLEELKFRNHYKVNVVAIKREGNIIVSPMGNDPISSGDTLVLIGAEQDLSRIEAFLSEK